MLTRILWTASIAGPEMEKGFWLILKTTGKLDDDSVQTIQKVYFEQMKPVLSEEDRADLRERYEMVRRRRMCQEDDYQAKRGKRPF